MQQRSPRLVEFVARVMGNRRGLPDVSLNASCQSTVNVYQGFTARGSPPGWHQVCGTSEATPLFAGVAAIADQAARHDLGLLNPALYALGDGPSSGITDITLGSNTVTFVEPSARQTITVQGYNATRGYDRASGLGTPDGARLVAQLAGLRRVNPAR